MEEGVTGSVPVPSRRDRSRVDTLVLVAFGLIALHAVDAWVVRPVGEAPPAIRLLRLAILLAVGGGLWAAWRAGGPRVRAFVALLVGGAAVIVGVGVSATAASTDGVDGAEATGLLALVAGLFLLGVGAVRLARPTRPWWRIPVAVVIGFAALEYVLVPLAMAVYATNAPHEPLGDRTPADVGLAAGVVAIRAEDGTRLEAWYVPSTNGAAVVLLHGSGSTRDDMLGPAAILAEHGYGVLLLDARGHGGSEGEPMEFGWGGEADVVAAIDVLAERPDVEPDRIGALGNSMGGEQALTAAALDERIRAVVAEGASARTYADLAALPGSLERTLGAPQSWLMMAVTDLLADASPPQSLADAVESIAPRPVLLISGSPAAEVDANRTFAERSDSVELWELPDTPHIGAIRTHRAEYEERVLAFLDAALLGT
jgi:pimeloyl-ACP methyl ester carboxylesterase